MDDGGTQTLDPRWIAAHEGYVDWIEDGRIGVVFLSPDGEMMLEGGPDLFPEGQRPSVREGSWATVTVDGSAGISVALADRGVWTEEDIAEARIRARSLAAALDRDGEDQSTGT